MAFLARAGVAIVLIAVVFGLVFRRQRRIQAATLNRATLRCRVSSLPRGYRRIESRLEPLGFRTVGDFDLCDADGRRIHRFLMSWNVEQSTLSLRGMHVAGFFTALDGTETSAPSLVVHTSIFDVDHTHPNHVVQTVRGVRHGTEQALLAIHDEAIGLLGQEGWRERRSQPDLNEFAIGLLVDIAAARSIGNKRTGLSPGAGAHRTYGRGQAQIGSALRHVDPSDRPDGAVGHDHEDEP